ncbi:MAG: hypothetical protein U0359_13425 [Byssovorax sp.]
MVLTPFIYEALYRTSEDVSKLKEILDDAAHDALTSPTLQVVFVGETHRTRDEDRRMAILAYALKRNDVLILIERGMVTSNHSDLKIACASSDLVAIEPEHESLSSGDDARNDLAFSLAMDLLSQRAAAKKALLILFGEDHEKRIRQRFITTTKLNRHVEWHVYPSANDLLLAGPRGSTFSSTHTRVGYTNLTNDDDAGFFLYPEQLLSKELVIELSSKQAAEKLKGLVVGVYIKNSENALIQDIGQYVPNEAYSLSIQNGHVSQTSDRAATAHVRFGLD